MLKNLVRTHETTIAEAVLSAADDHSSTIEELTVRLWEADRLRFGLAGFADHFPDPRKVASTIMGKKGLVGRGLLAQNGRMYTLTADGKRRLAGEAEKPPAPACNGHAPAVRSSASPHNALLRRLFATRVWACRDHKERLNFADAMDFLGLNHAMDAIQLQLDDQAGALLDAQMADATTLNDGRCVQAWELESLVECQTWLCKRFGSHLSLLQTRKAVRQ